MTELSYVLVAAACVYNAEASVLKTGTPAPLTINETFTPIGALYMKGSLFHWIFPGTKWCGDGDIADHYDDLGRFSTTDACCRDHDFCEDVLYNGQSKDDLVNTHAFTRLHCNCDIQFYACLRATKDRFTSQLIGLSYFDVLAAQCYSLLHPATCIKFDSTLGFNKRCVRYKYNYAEPPRWQWFDVPKWTTFL